MMMSGSFKSLELFADCYLQPELNLRLKYMAMVYVLIDTDLQVV